MTVLRNNFSAGPDGTTITPSNSGSIPGDDPFDNVVKGTGGTAEYSTDYSKQTAQYTAHLATGATATTAMLGWGPAMGTQTQIWFREYILLAGYPSGFNPTMFVCDNGAVYNSSVAFQASTGKLIVINGATTQTSTFTTSISLGQWYRIECRFQFSTSTGNWDAKLFAEPDSDTPTESLSGANWNLGAASATEYIFGLADTRANQPDLYISGLELNNTGFPGPAPFRQGLGYPAGNLTNPIAIHMN